MHAIVLVGILCISFSYSTSVIEVDQQKRILPRKRIAIAFSGLLRHYRLTSQPFFDNLIFANDDVATFDIFIYASADELPDQKIDTTEVVKLYKPLKYVFVPPSKYAGLGNAMTQEYKVAECFSLIRQYELSNNFTYDLVLRIRFDVLLLEPWDVNIFLSNNCTNCVYVRSACYIHQPWEKIKQRMQNEIASGHWTLRHEDQRFWFDGLYFLDSMAMTAFMQLKNWKSGGITPEAACSTVMWANDVVAQQKLVTGFTFRTIILSIFKRGDIRKNLSTMCINTLMDCIKVDCLIRDTTALNKACEGVLIYYK